MGCNARDEAHVKKSLHVLIVEDEQALLNEMTNFIKDHIPCAIKTASTFSDAVTAIAQMTPDLSFVDNIIPLNVDSPPQQLGLKLVREIKAHAPNSIVVLATAWDMNSDALSEAYANGVFRVLSKPFDSDQLLTIISQATDIPIAGPRQETESAPSTQVQSATQEMPQAAMLQSNRKTRQLEAMLRVSNAISSQLELSPILDTACKAAVELIGVDHSGLAILSEDGSNAIVQAEYPELGLKRSFIPIKGVPIEERLVDSKEPIILYNVASSDELGPVKQILINADICSILIVPVISHGRVIASFSLDAIHAHRSFDADDLEICRLLASQLAIGIENCRLFRAVQNKADQLEIFKYAALAMTSYPDRQQLVNKIISCAVDLVNAQSGGIIQKDRDGSLKVLALSNASTCPVAQVMQGASTVLNVSDAHLILDDRESWANAGIDRDPPAALLLAKISSGAEPIGILFVLDDVGRKFDRSADAKAILQIAQYADVALGNLDLFDREREASDRLTLLLRARREVSVSSTLDEALNRLAELFTNALDKTFTRLFVLDESEQILMPYASFPRARAGSQLQWDPNNAGALHISSIPRFSDFLSRSLPLLFLSSTADHAPWLARAGERLALNQPLSSLLLLPLLHNRVLVGLISVGEVRDLIRSPFDRLCLEKAATLAPEVAAIVAQFRQSEVLLKSKVDLERLTESLRSLSALSERSALGQAIAEEALKLFDASAVALCMLSSARTINPEVQACGDSQLCQFLHSLSASQMDSIASSLTDDLAIFDLTDGSHPSATIYDIFAVVNIRSVRLALIRADQDEVALLLICSKTLVVPADRHRLQLERFSAQAAICLRQARAFGDIAFGKQFVELIARVMTFGKHREVLGLIVNVTNIVARSDAVVLFEYDPLTGKFNHPPVMIGVHDQKQLTDSDGVKKDSIVYKLLTLKEPFFVQNTTIDPLFCDTRFRIQEQIESCMVLPLRADNSQVGLMFINYRSKQRTTEVDFGRLRVFADQASIAIANSQLFERVNKHANTLSALCKASRLVSASLDFKVTLAAIAEEACKCAAQGRDGKCYSDIRLLEGEKAKLQAFYPPELEGTTYQRFGRDLNLSPSQCERLGIVGRVIVSGTPEIIDDVTNDPDYLAFNPDVRSELTVPIKHKDQVIGAINVEHSTTAAFNNFEKDALLSLADQANIAIQNAKSYEALLQIKGIVGSSTAIQWMKMVSSAWGHSIGRKVGFVRTRLEEVQSLIAGVPLADATKAEIVEIYRLLNEISQVPILAPLSPDDDVTALQLNSVLSRFLDRLWTLPPFLEVAKPIQVLASGLDEQYAVRASRPWLELALENILENAVRSVLLCPRLDSIISVITAVSNSTISIEITDTGGGIRAELLDTLSYRPVPKDKNEKGAGVGLMVTRNIIETYNGRLSFANLPQGTRVTIAFPAEPIIGCHDV